MAEGERAGVGPTVDLATESGRGIGIGRNTMIVVPAGAVVAVVSCSLAGIPSSTKCV